MIKFTIIIYSSEENEINWCKNNLNSKSYGHITNKLIGERRQEDVEISTYPGSPYFTIIMTSYSNIPCNEIIKAIKAKLPDCSCYGTIRESKIFSISDKGRIAYDYDIPLSEED